MLAVVALLLGARPHRLVDPIPWPELVEERFPAVSAVLGRTAPVFLVAGDTVPHDGWLLAGAGYPRLGEQYRAQEAALEQCYWGRRGDRSDADAVHRSTIEGLKVCRANKPRDFAAGVGVGFGSCAAAGWIIEGARP